MGKSNQNTHTHTLSEAGRDKDKDKQRQTNKILALLAAEKGQTEGEEAGKKEEQEVLQTQV